MKKNDDQNYEHRLRELGERLHMELQHQVETIAEEANPVGVDSSVPTHPADNNAELLDASIAVGESQTQLLQQVHDALERIRTKTFGQCVNCGEAIATDRLDALPYAALCIDCARSSERLGE